MFDSYDRWKLASPFDDLKDHEHSVSFRIIFPERFRDKIDSELRAILKNIEIDIVDEGEGTIFLNVWGDYCFEGPGKLGDDDVWLHLSEDLYYAFKEFYEEIEIEKK